MQNSGWGDLLTDKTARDQFTEGCGFYKYDLSSETGMVLIVLNTNLYYKSNRATAGADDPGDQIAWCRRKLTLIRLAREKVLSFN